MSIVLCSFTSVSSNAPLGVVYHVPNSLYETPASFHLFLDGRWRNLATSLSGQELCELLKQRYNNRLAITDIVVNFDRAWRVESFGFKEQSFPAARAPKAAYLINPSYGIF